MKTEQISLTVPNVLYKESKEYVKEYGYKNVQELVLDLLRQKVVLEKIERYGRIDKELNKQKGMNQKDAIKYLKGL